MATNPSSLEDVKIVPNSAPNTASSPHQQKNNSENPQNNCADNSLDKEDVLLADLAHPADLADHLEQLSLKDRVNFLVQMDTEDAADALAEMEGPEAVKILESLDEPDAVRILSEMWPDDAVDVLDELGKPHRDKLLEGLPPKEAQELRALLTFDPDTAAGVMNTEIILINEDVSVDDAIHQIRDELEDKEMPYYVYVVDGKETLVGVLSLRDLMLSPHGRIIRDELVNQDLITVPFDADKAEAARLLGHYNFLSLPVVDREGHMMGMITHDDVIDILQDEASSDMLGMVGAGQDESVDTPWLDSVKMRLPWLLVNLLNSSLSAFIVYLFEGSIAQMALLAVMMPMVANQAGNTGQQALAVMIRQLATERFDRRKSWLAVLREGKIGFLSGLIMATCCFTGVTVFFRAPKLAAIMGMALLMDMVLGALAGGSIPLVLRALKRDPAQASSIFLTALTDGAGFFIFLSLATLFLL